MRTPVDSSPLHSSRVWRLSALILVSGLLLVGAGELRAASAVFFDGADDYVTFGKASGLGASTFTVETWFKRSGPGTAVSTGTGGVSAIPLVSKGRSEADGSNLDMNYFLGIRASDNVLCADFEEGAAGVTPGLNHPVAGVTPIANNVWYHAAATYDGTAWRLYLNGGLEAQLSVGRPPRADSIQHAALGSTLNSTGAPLGGFAGVLDEVRIWNFARSSAEIAANRDAEILNGIGLLGRWGLDEGAGTAAADSTGNGIVGTLINGPLWVAGFQQSSAPLVVRGPYLQTGTPSSIIVKWRTDIASDGRVRYGLSATDLNLFADDPASTTEHQVQVTGLAPDTQYFYSIGSSATTLATGADFSFFTAPPVGTAHPTRVWVLGDSGTKGATAAGVRDGYASYAAGRYTDVWLMLGDNAYDTGTDPEFQAAVFNMYPSYLRQSVLWSVIGNHETAQATNPPLTIPYFNIFTFPTNAEAGGVPSGTEKYYSFDYGRIHFIALDSMTSSRTAGSPMLTWLQADLEATSQDWIIALWHHPPYTKGSHDSDTETELTQMRQNILPLLEAGGVDLVLTGHSHCYERSYFINGHYGTSTTFGAANRLDGGNGRGDGTGSYSKPGGLAANQGAVYVVAGNGGHVTNWTGGSTAEFNPTPHPAMYYSALHTGSLVLDIDSNRLDAKLIRESGAIDDYFSIVKNVQNAAPSVTISAPQNGTIFTAPASITISADATDSDGSIAQVDFYANNALVGTKAIAPFSVAWDNVSAGSYALTAVATDNLGATTSSSAVNVTVNAAAQPPSAPIGVSATPGNAQVALTWSASTGATSYSVKRSAASGGAYTTLAGGLSSNSYTDVTVTNGVTYFYVVSASNAAGESANSSQVTATPAAPATPPAAPTNLVARTVSKSRIDLTWSDNATNETGYLIERSNNGSSFTQIATVAANVTSYSATNLAPKKQYYFRVRATGTAGNSAYSNVANATTLK